MLTTTTDTPAPRLFMVEDFDPDGGSYVNRRWRTDEATARRYFAKHEAYGARRLIGRGGLILAVAS